MLCALGQLVGGAIQTTVVVPNIVINYMQVFLLSVPYCNVLRRLTDRVQRSCSVEQSAPTLARNMSLATFKTKLKTYLFRRSQWLLKTTRRCCGGFAISAPWYKWLYLLTYLLIRYFCCMRDAMIVWYMLTPCISSSIFCVSAHHNLVFCKNGYGL